MESTAAAVVQGNTSWQMPQFTLLPQARLRHQLRTTLYQKPKVRFLEVQHKRAAENITAEMQSQYHHHHHPKKKLWKIVNSSFLKNAAVGKRTRSPQFQTGLVQVSAPVQIILVEA